MLELLGLVVTVVFLVSLTLMPNIPKSQNPDRLCAVILGNRLVILEGGFDDPRTKNADDRHDNGDDA